MVNGSTTVHVEVLVATWNIALPRDEGTQQVHNMKNEVARNNSLTVIVCYYVTLSTPSLISALVQNCVALLERHMDFIKSHVMRIFFFNFLCSKEGVQSPQIFSLV